MHLFMSFFIFSFSCFSRLLLPTYQLHSFCGIKFMLIHLLAKLLLKLLPVCASEQGNVIGLVSVYIYMCVQKKFVIERTRDLIYLKFVMTDFSPKIISPSAGENSGDLV